MKYLRSLMQQSVTACKNQAKLIQQFTLSLLYLLIIHIVALLFFFLFRLVLFTSIDYQFPPDIQNNFLMQATAFIKGLWFDNVIACYIFTISHFMDNRSLQLSLQVGIQIYLYLFHSILFTVVHYFGSQHPLFLLFF